MITHFKILFHPNNFQLHVECNDPHARSIGQEGNAFKRPVCKCSSGFQSSNRKSYDSLLHETDVCVPCDTFYERCGEVPSSPPTNLPTVTSLPTLNPTVSGEPTNFPTETTIPTSQPSTHPPTFELTISNKPSLQPTPGPSSYASIFDGQHCKFDIECISSTCKNSTCFSKVTKKRLPSFSLY